MFCVYTANTQAHSQQNTSFFLFNRKSLNSLFVKSCKMPKCTRSKRSNRHQQERNLRSLFFCFEEEEKFHAIYLKPQMKIYDTMNV